MKNRDEGNGGEALWAPTVDLPLRLPAKLANRDLKD